MYLRICKFLRTESRIEVASGCRDGKVEVTVSWVHSIILYLVGDDNKF